MNLPDSPSADPSTGARRGRLVLVALAGLVGAVWCVGWVLPRPDWRAYLPADNPCSTAASAQVLVSSASHTLVLCEGGEPVFAAPVRLGSGGMDKRQEGDRRTPVGAYPLAAPRASGSGFGWFIEVGYPTDEQRADGYTGSAIGIHGPHWLARPVTSNAVFAWISLLVGRPDTSAGCVSMESMDELMQVVEFVQRTRAGVRIDQFGG